MYMDVAVVTAWLELIRACGCPASSIAGWSVVQTSAQEVQAERTEEAVW